MEWDQTSFCGTVCTKPTHYLTFLLSFCMSSAILSIVPGELWETSLGVFPFICSLDSTCIWLEEEPERLKREPTDEMLSRSLLPLLKSLSLEFIVLESTFTQEDLWLKVAEHWESLGSSSPPFFGWRWNRNYQRDSKVFQPENIIQLEHQVCNYLRMLHVSSLNVMLGPCRAFLPRYKSRMARLCDSKVAPKTNYSPAWLWHGRQP